MSSNSQEPVPSPPIFTFFMIVALLAVWGLVWDVIHTADGGSIDFRNRITGVRVASEHRDPYFFKWNRTESERLCDPFTFPASPVNHTTVTPVTLSLFYPLKDLPYNVSRWIWFGVQYAALGLGFWAWARGSDRKNWLWGGLLTCLFCLSPHWRLHIDRGQSYVVYAGLFLALAAVARGLKGGVEKTSPGEAGNGGRSWAEGILASMLAVLRPTYAVLLGWGVARKNRSVIVASVVGLAVWAVLPTLLAGQAIWSNYFKAMGVHAQLYLTQTRFPAARFSASETIEKIPVDTFLRFPRIPFSDTSIYRLLSFNVPGSPQVWLAVWACGAAVSGFLFMRRKQVGGPRFWWAVSAWILVGDFILPAYRYSYNNVLLWPVLLLGLNALPEAGAGRGRKLWLTVSAGLLGMQVATWFLPNSFISWPGVGALVLGLGVVVGTFLPGRKVGVGIGVGG
ncbi:MAG: hypothetical protein JWL81_1519 [Verrucomicrobiales bacterium]|nr:hypothetical protein [Verrucomicrobiales bacterium]